MSDNITDLINQEIAQEVAGYEPEAEPQYTRQDEAEARKRSEQAYKESFAKGIAEKVKSESRTVTKTAPKDDMKEVLGKYDQEIAELKKQLAEATNVLKTTRDATERNSDRFLGLDVLEEERQIQADPTFGNYFDNTARDLYKRIAKEEGRYISPYEAMAISKFPDVVKKLAEYEQKAKFQEEFLGHSFGGRSVTSFGDEELDGVTTPEEAERLARKRAKKFY